MSSEDQFLETEEVQDVAQNHIERILSLEEAESKRIIKLYRQIRQELRDRLDTLPDGSFSQQQVRGVLYQIETAIQAMSQRLRSEMDSSAQKAAEKGIEDLLKELGEYNHHFSGAVVPINVDALAIATDTKNFLFNKYETSMEVYNQSLRSRFAHGLTQAALEQVSMSEVIRRIGATFLGEEWQIQRIVRTELHNIYSLGKMNTMLDLWDGGEGDIPDLKKALFHPIDNRTANDSKYAESLQLVVPINEPFVYYWKGQERRFMAPPDRPNDRSILIPYRDSWRA